MDAVTMMVAAKSDVGRTRTNNEDSYTVLDLTSGSQLGAGTTDAELEVGHAGVLLALSDGMGGHQAGEVASAMVLESLRSAMQAGGDEAIEKRIEAAVLRANADVVRAARTGNKKGMGATLTAVFAAGADAYIAEVGDSRAYLLREGKLRQITRDQSLVQMLVDGGVLSPEEAKHSPQKNVILQAMGLANEVRVAIARLHLRRADTILICCDGLSNALSDDELKAILIASEPATACTRLIDLANDRGGEDNLTAIVARFGGEGLPAASPAASLTATFEVLQDFTKAPSKRESPQTTPVEPIRPPPAAEAQHADSRPAPALARSASVSPRTRAMVYVALALFALVGCAYLWSRN